MVAPIFHCQRNAVSGPDIGGWKKLSFLHGQHIYQCFFPWLAFNVSEVDGHNMVFIGNCAGVGDCGHVCNGGFCGQNCSFLNAEVLRTVGYLSQVKVHCFPIAGAEFTHSELPDDHFLSG